MARPINLENCGAALAKLRNDRKVTAAAVAQELGMDKATMSRLDAGLRELKLTEYVKYMDYLGLLPGDHLAHTVGINEILRPLMAMIEDRKPDDIRKITNLVAAYLDIEAPLDDNTPKKPSIKKVTGPRRPDGVGQYEMHARGK